MLHQSEASCFDGRRRQDLGLGEAQRHRQRPVFVLGYLVLRTMETAVCDASEKNSDPSPEAVLCSGLAIHDLQRSDDLLRTGGLLCWEQRPTS